MKSHIIKDDDGKGFVLAFEGDEVVDVNPIDYYAQSHIHRNKILTKAMLRAKNPLLESWISDGFYQKHAEDSWAAIQKQIDATAVPE